MGWMGMRLLRVNTLSTAFLRLAASVDSVPTRVAPGCSPAAPRGIRGLTNTLVRPLAIDKGLR